MMVKSKMIDNDGNLIIF
ncbi:unnamed protein product, partial [Rotaria sp. Silwood1]